MRVKTVKELPVITLDPAMRAYESDIQLRMDRFEAVKKMLLSERRDLAAFADGASRFGLHFLPDGSAVIREWAPGADEIHLYGDFNFWDRFSDPMKKTSDGCFEITLPPERAPKHGTKLKMLVTKNGVTTEHIPPYAFYVTQDKDTYVWSQEVYHPEKPFEWHDASFSPEETPLIYECHIGMATEEYRVGTYLEFRDHVLPRIQADGYNTIQIMAIQEHPYYASFGYQVANFFAPSSRYGTPDELRSLIDEAHRRGIRVLLDVVHSHAVGNEREGLSRFDGTDDQYFYPGDRGNHPAWGTKLFNYGRKEVLYFLLSNLKYWMSEFHFDGFRFDGVTSMLYRDHGLGTAFDNYDKYFSMNTDVEAVAYLMAANEMIHAYRPKAITIAEDMSGMPGMCLPVSDGGIGFDFRLAMGTPDLWIRYAKDTRDEDWNLGKLYGEITGHRPKEKVIGYVESHDQALVGDQTMMFRFAGADMYDHMRKDDHGSYRVDRAMALHKMSRLLTFSLSPDGYLNFMGNEFGHPEWIDFPREGNGWSYHHARRQWSLADRPDLRYSFLLAFDQAMLREGKEAELFRNEPCCTYIHEDDKVIVYQRGDDLFAMNFHYDRSYEGYFLPVLKTGTYEAVLSTDEGRFGGFDRIDLSVRYRAEKQKDGRIGYLMYLPSRTAVVFRRIGE
ncbi:MAG: alpha amylase C-terminal domain-containing protein [Lachnospiraceae bacterium]|nr:alpha amylase C-terminal domain-containing protein [Lachnospiraceae bacterium]MBR4769072.1 alpha amylase C-terminal domain-containing protein [Lachnospiraceae bacterium]